MTKRQSLLVVLIFISALVSLASPPAVAQCCVSEEGGCQPTTTTERCVDLTVYRSESCGSIPECEIVCCAISPVENEPRYKVSCPAPLARFLEFDFTPAPATFSDQCVTCTEDITQTCPDGSTITLADCVVGRPVPTAQQCPTAPVIGPDVDGDGVPDAMDQCPLEPQLSAPTNTSETPGLTCNDQIDNDCDALTDVVDPDCAGACIDDLESTCPDGAVIVTAECVGGVLSPTGETCPGIITIPTGVCSDGIVQTPNAAYSNEDCEADADCGVNGVCITASSPADLRAQGSLCSCYYECSAEPGEIFDLTVTSHNGINNLTWALGTSASCSLSYFDVYKCSTDGESCNPEVIVHREENPSLRAVYRYGDVDVAFDTNYCYKVIAHYAELGTEVTSEVRCISSGNAICAERGGRFCSDDRTQVLQCTDNEPLPYDTCVGNEICVDSSPELARCVSQDPCDQCNNLFRIFGVIPGFSDFGRGMCEALTTCAIDYTKTAVNKWHQCSEIQSCYDYASQAACEQNACGVSVDGSPPDCEWKPAILQVGAGVCRPKDIDRQECDKCAYDTSIALYQDPKFNKIFNACDATTCRLYGTECFLADGACQNSDALGCRAYGGNQEACISASLSAAKKNATFRISYSTFAGNIIRYNGTNNFTQKSDDLFTYNTCTYQPDEGCFKDADYNRVPDCGSLATYDRECEKDNTPPMTIIKKDGLQLVEGRLLLSRTIDLELSMSESAKTYYCIAGSTTGQETALAAIASTLPVPAVGGSPPGAFEPADSLSELAPSRGINSCYPATSTACRIQQILPEGSINGNARVFYYSEDDNKNLEVVKRENVKIDTSPPTIMVSHTISGRDMTIDMTAPEEVTCFAHLENEDGIEMRASPEAATSHRIDGERDTMFSRVFYSLPDDTYYWKYQCYDTAGNARIEQRIIDLDLNGIHDPQPHGPRNSGADLIISVETDASAECRYKERSGLVAPAFEDMEPMLSDDGLYHQRPIFVGCVECYKVYNIKCRMENTSQVQGERNDRVRFSIDTQGPRVEAYGDMNATVPFDQEITYGAPQTIFLRCMDDSIEQATGIKNFDFGCSNVTVTIPGIGENQYNHTPAVPMGPIIVDSTTSLLYTAIDEAGQTRMGDVIVEIDDSGPTLATDIIDLISSARHEGGETLGPGGYTIRLRSNALLKEVDARLDIDNTSVINQPLSLYSGSLFEKQFYLPILGLEEGTYAARVRITATQAMPGAKCTLEGNAVDIESTTTIEFGIDTFVPTITLEPLFDGVQDEADDITDFRDYRVYRYNYTYYTNRESLFVTGFMDNQSKIEDIRFFTGQEDADLAEPSMAYSIEENNAEDLVGLPSTFALNQPASAGENTITLNAPPAGVFTNNYLYLGHERETYEHYHDFYRVISVSGNAATLAEPLEQNVDFGFMPQVFEKPHPYNWFGANISLALGMNKLMVRGRSLTGVESSSPIFDIILDIYPPEVIASSPRQGSRNLPVDSISFRVREAKGTAMLDEDSVSLTINDEEVPVTIASEDAGLFVVYNITYAMPIPIMNGTYHVVLSGRDRAGNEFAEAGGSKDFTFTIDDGLPTPPSWVIKEATFHDAIWYTNHSPDFIINFTANDLPVTITGIFLQLYGTSSSYEILVNCTQPTMNLFDCHPLVPMTINSAYELMVEAHKQYPEAMGPTGAFYSEPVVLDNLRPNMVFVYYKNPTVERKPLNVEVAIPNERFPLKAMWHYLGDGVVYALNMTGNDHRGNYVFTWQVPDYSIATHAHIMNPNIVILSITDYANNGPSVWNGTIRIDLVPPDLSGFTFTPMVEYASPETQEYYTRHTAVNITGGFTDDDIAAISVVPGNWIVSQIQPQPISFANIKADNTFDMQLLLQGRFNDTLETNYTIIVEDIAGNRVSIPFKIYTDLKPPAQPILIFS